METLIRLAVTLVAFYAVLCALAYLFQDRLIFYPTAVWQDPRADHVQPVSLERPDAVLRGWVVKPAAAGPVVVYYGGNAEELSYLADAFARLNATTLLMNYRGYGRSDGKPAAAALIEDARAVAGTLAPHYGSGRPLILVGRSLGSGIAAAVARSVPVDGVILMSPFRSLGHMARRVMPWLPTSWLLRHEIDVLAALEKLPAETLVLYSPGDQVIPAAETLALLEQFPTRPQVVEFAGGHNAPLTQPDIWRPVEAFVGGLSR